MENKEKKWICGYKNDKRCQICFLNNGFSRYWGEGSYCGRYYNEFGCFLNENGKIINGKNMKCYDCEYYINESEVNDSGCKLLRIKIYVGYSGYSGIL